MIADTIPFTDIGGLSQPEGEQPKLLPVELGKRLQTRARKSTSLKLDNYIELRDFISENEDKIMSIGWMEFYEEAGDWMY